MKIELSVGEVVVGVNHKLNSAKRRVTRVWLKKEDFEYKASAACSPEDNFCKRTGRRIAANRLLNELRHNGAFTKEDRRKVFMSICPEYDEEPTFTIKEIVESYIYHVITVGRSWGLSISHDDIDGSFKIVPYNATDADWLRCAAHEMSKDTV